MQRLPMLGQIPLGGVEGARPQQVPLGVQVAVNHYPEGQRCARSLLPFGGGIDTELNLGEALAGDLAGVLQGDLADVAQAFTPLLGPHPVLGNPALARPRNRTPNPGRYRPRRCVGLAGWKISAATTSFVSLMIPSSASHPTRAVSGKRMGSGLLLPEPSPANIHHVLCTSYSEITRATRPPARSWTPAPPRVGQRHPLGAPEDREQYLHALARLHPGVEADVAGERALT